MSMPRSTSIDNFRKQKHLRKQEIVEKFDLTWKQIISDVGPVILMAGGLLIVFAIFMPLLLVILFG